MIADDAIKIARAAIDSYGLKAGDVSWHFLQFGVWIIIYRRFGDGPRWSVAVDDREGRRADLRG